MITEEVSLDEEDPGATRHAAARNAAVWSFSDGEKPEKLPCTAGQGDWQKEMVHVGSFRGAVSS